MRLGEQRAGLEIVKGWVQRAGVAYLQRSCGVRDTEIRYGLEAIDAVQKTLGWVEDNRAEIDAWIAAKKQGG